MNKLTFLNRCRYSCIDFRTNGGLLNLSDGLGVIEMSGFSPLKSMRDEGFIRQDF
jgi:hypothetical protein